MEKLSSIQLIKQEVFDNAHQNAPENLARLRQISLSLLSQEKTAQIGVANKRLKSAWDDDYLAKVLRA